MPRPAQPGFSPAALGLCALVLAGATAAAYHGGLGGAFLYDDLESVVGNASIRHLSTALAPPAGTTVSGRPLLNLTFALNYAAAGTEVWGYHALNIALHAAAALLLFGIVRRTLALPAAGARPAPECAGVALAVALLWALHPLQTESVAYVVQRAESLMGLLYLLMLYAFIRHAAPGGPGRAWGAVSLAACLCGMASKEVMATAPLVVLLYDRTFLCGTFREAWRRRRPLYLAYAACWVPLAFLVAGTGGRGGSAGFGSGVPWWAYALTQVTAVAHYLRLALWPHPLVGDYGRILAGSPREVALCAAVVLPLAAATLLLLRRRPALGFLGAWFFLILAPSSSVIPVSTEIMAEHRMYLPLAAVVTLVVLGLNAVLGRRALLASVGLAALGLGLLTARRLRVYEGPLAFWSDVAIRVPANAGAWNNLGILTAARGDPAGAIADYRRALALAPAYAYAHYNLGNSLAATGRTAEAVGEYEEALAFRPEDPSIHFNLGNALLAEHRDYAASAEYRESLRLDPGRADAWFNLAGAMEKVGNLPEAAAACSRAVALRPDFPDARVNYGNVLAQQGRLAEAVAQLTEALRLEPGAADIHNNIGSVLANSGRLAEAQAQFEEALRLKPDYAEARENLERVRVLQPGQGRP